MTFTILLALALTQLPTPAPVIDSTASGAGATGGFLEVVVPSKPDATRIQLTSDQPAAVVETRTVHLAAGDNRLRFDWSRERVDENSVRVEVAPAAGTASIASREKIKRLGNTLYFVVNASTATDAVVTTRYLLWGIGWRVDYTGIVAGADADAQKLELRQTVEVSNGSGKDLDGVTLRFEGGEVAGLALKQGERREVEVFRVADVPLVKRYVFDLSRFGGTPGVELEIDDAAGGALARRLLPAGKIRLFAKDGDQPPKLVGEDVFPATVLGEKARFSTGLARDITVERRVASQVNENERRDRWNKVVAYDQRTKLSYKVKNGAGRAIKLRVVEQPGAPFTIVAAPPGALKKKSDVLEFDVDLVDGIANQVTFDVEWLRSNLF